MSSNSWNISLYSPRPKSMRISPSPGSVLMVSVMFELEVPSFDVSNSENSENLTEDLIDSRH